MSSNYEFIEPYALKEEIELIRQGNQTTQFVIIDVRDEDYSGGHIPESINIPSSQFHNSSNYEMLLDKYGDKKYFIFHCFYSKQRGPSAAAAFANFVESKYKDQNEEKPKM